MKKILILSITFEFVLWNASIQYFPLLYFPLENFLQRYVSPVCRWLTWYYKNVNFE
ncbi:MAG: hypothetical protein H6Q14_3021 [Bacteroidetes bacterium]|jgi:hypothetical protein|nr:hypothetical protein [Bacteroidota bacterium]